MAKRKAGEHLATLGLGGYASDDAEDDAEEDGVGVVKLLGAYNGGDSESSEVNGENGPNESPGLGPGSDNIEVESSESPGSRTGEDPPLSPANGVNASPPRHPLDELPLELRNPPPGDCKPDLKEKFSKFLRIKKSQGSSVNEQLRRSKGYRNPDFLNQCVQYFNVCDVGSNFPKEVFDPSNVQLEDTPGELMKQMAEQVQRRQKEQAEKGRIEFTKGATQQPPVPTASASGQSRAAQDKPPTSSSAQARRSKWDNVPIR